MKRPRTRTSNPMAATLLAAAAFSFPSASASYTRADYNRAQPVNGKFKCTAPGAAGPSAAYRTATPFHLLQFCFVPDQSAYLYLRIDFGDGQMGQFGAQVTEGVEYCRPKLPKPVLGRSVRHAHVEFDGARVVQATILSSSEGCVVFEGEVPEDAMYGFGVENDNGNRTADDEGQIKWLEHVRRTGVPSVRPSPSPTASPSANPTRFPTSSPSAAPEDFSIHEHVRASDGNTEVPVAQEVEDETSNEEAAISEVEDEKDDAQYDLGFEIVPPSRYGDLLGPVQAIIGLDKGDGVKSEGATVMPRYSCTMWSLLCALQIALLLI